MEPGGLPELMNFADLDKLTNFTELTKIMEKRPNAWKSLNSQK